MTMPPVTVAVAVTAATAAAAIMSVMKAEVFEVPRTVGVVTLETASVLRWRVQTALVAFWWRYKLRMRCSQQGRLRRLRCLRR